MFNSLLLLIRCNSDERHDLRSRDDKEKQEEGRGDGLKERGFLCLSGSRKQDKL